MDFDSYMLAAVYVIVLIFMWFFIFPLVEQYNIFDYFDPLGRMDYFIAEPKNPFFIIREQTKLPTNFYTKQIPQFDFITFKMNPGDSVFKMVFGNVKDSQLKPKLALQGETFADRFFMEKIAWYKPKSSSIFAVAKEPGISKFKYELRGNGEYPKAAIIHLVDEVPQMEFIIEQTPYTNETLITKYYELNPEMKSNK